MKYVNKYWKKLLQNIDLSARHGGDSARLTSRGITSNVYENTLTADDLEYLWQKQDGKCYWLHIEMSLEDLFIKDSPFAVSTDRMDCSQGYTLENVVLTTRFANRGRGAYNGDEFIKRLNELFRKRDEEISTGHRNEHATQHDLDLCNTGC